MKRKEDIVETEVTVEETPVAAEKEERCRINLRTIKNDRPNHQVTYSKNGKEGIPPCLCLLSYFLSTYMSSAKQSSA